MHNNVREPWAARLLRREDLAQAVTVSRPTIDAIETSRHLLSLQQAVALGYILGKPVEELFNGDDDGR